MGVERETGSGENGRFVARSWRSAARSWRSAGAGNKCSRRWSSTTRGGIAEVDDGFRIERKRFSFTISQRNLIQICELLPRRSYRIWVDVDSLLKIRDCLTDIHLHPAKIGWTRFWVSGNRSFTVARLLNSAGAVVMISEQRKDGVSRIYLPEGVNGLGLRTFCSKINEVASSLLMTYQFQFTDDLCYCYEPTKEDLQRLWRPSCCLANRSDFEVSQPETPSQLLLLADFQRQGITPVIDPPEQQVHLEKPSAVPDPKDIKDSSVAGEGLSDSAAASPFPKSIDDSTVAGARLSYSAAKDTEEKLRGDSQLSKGSQTQTKTQLSKGLQTRTFDSNEQATENGFANSGREALGRTMTENGDRMELQEEDGQAVKGDILQTVVSKKATSHSIPHKVEDLEGDGSTKDVEAQETTDALNEKVHSMVVHEIPGYKGGTKLSATLLREDGTEIESGSHLASLCYLAAGGYTGLGLDHEDISQPYRDYVSMPKPDYTVNSRKGNKPKHGKRKNKR